MDYLWGRIQDPKSILPTSIMPRFNLKDEDIKALVVFLKSRRGVNFAETSLDRYKAHIENVAVVIPPVVVIVSNSTCVKDNRPFASPAAPLPAR